MITVPSRVYVPAAIAAAVLFGGQSARAQFFSNGDVVVSESIYSDLGQVANLHVGDALPGGGTAVADGSSLNVFLNETPDASFGVGSQITIQNLTSGNSLSLDPTKMVTSFPSKSEIGLNFSADGSTLTFMGYAPNSTSASGVGQLDISNANTPGHVDPTNPDTSPLTQRAVGAVSASGSLSVTGVNAYSGNNGRSAILANNVNGTGANNIYMVGNAGNGSGTEPANIINNTGVQMIQQGASGDTTVVGALQGPPGVGSNKNGNQYGFSVTQLGYAADKSGKDDNFRGETIFNNTLYVTKGSGGNGIDTVYQVGTQGSLPTAATASTTAINVLPGFNTTLASAAITAQNAATANFHPFGLFFANAFTLYVADEGDGTLANAGTSMDPNAGLEKWSLVNGTWKLDYTLRSGLIGSTYNPSGMIIGGKQVTVTTDGLRSLAGKVNADGTVSLYAVTSTLDNATGFDAGADPNELVEKSDVLANTTAAQAAGETFTVAEQAFAGQVFRGVAVDVVPAPEASTWGAGISAMSLAVMFTGFFRRNRKK